MVDIFISGDNDNSELSKIESITIDPGSTEEYFEKPNISISGNIDSYDHGFVYGWAMNQDEPKSSVAVNVMLGSVCIGCGEANIFREDLLLAGLGDGKHAFKIKVKPIPADGLPYKIYLMDDTSGKRIECNALEIKNSDSASISIHNIEFGHLSGEVVGLATSEDHAPLILSFDNGRVTENCGAVRGQDGKYRFNIKIPSELMDGMPHIIVVTIPGHPGVEASYVDVLPAILTSWEHLVSSAKELTYGAISRTAAFRYDSLKRNVEQLTKSGTDVKSITNLMTAHQAVVEGYESRKKYPKISLPNNQEPDVSIVIPVHNKFSLTYHCLASLVLAQNVASYEVIVVDDVSTDETIDIAKYIENIHLITNKTNLGFLRNCNKAVKEAHGKYVVMLNNDTEVTSGWLDELISTFDRISMVGIAGSKLIYPDGKLQEAGGIVWGNGHPWNLGNGGNPQNPEWNYVRQVDYLSGAAIMIPRVIWNEVGGFSEEFAPAYYEDTDIAFKVRAAGYKTVYVPQSVVIHFEGMSNGRDESKGIKKNQAINAPKFRAKWVDDYINNGQPCWENVWRNKDRNVTCRVLMIDYATPMPDHDAGSYAAVQEMRMLQANGCKITFVPENMAHMGKYTDALQRAGVECLYYPFYDSIQNILEKRGREFDLVYITRYDVADRYIDHIRRHASAKVMFNNADLHFLRELRMALSKGDRDLSGPLATRDKELALMRNVDAILTYNSTEQAVIMSHNLNNENMYICPWVLNTRGHQIPFKERTGIAFLGGYRHTPNIEAVEFFVTDIMPLLRKKIPDVIFHIYGSHMPESFKKFEVDDVILEGFVESLDDVFETCRVFVAPLRSGAGIKGKVLEAMACGIPTVLTSIAAEGTGLSHGINAYLAERPSEWVEGIAKLYEDEALWNEFSKNALRLAENNFSFEHGQSAMRTALNGVGIYPPNNCKAIVTG
ncbi:glycosyltransferase [Acidithiobacillus sp.]|uniref:glycosyltransferase n=1 Tax=Acidithiobacillus sp. TaxID=1872118 RepID=UPI00260A911E|nr:glycosyltransferase [Acidithiobacillus sp.]MDD5280398.1 glycosyltransferase [Acidithiobacillus sp.]